MDMKAKRTWCPGRLFAFKKLLSIAITSAFISFACGLVNGSDGVDRKYVEANVEGLEDEGVLIGGSQPSVNDACESRVSGTTTIPVAKDPLQFQSSNARVKFSLAGVLQQSGVTGSWWNLSQTYAPDTNYKLDRAWAETWIRPAMTGEVRVGQVTTLYSGIAYVGSGNIGRDVFEQGNRGQFAIEDGFLGARFGETDDEVGLDVSYGRQPYKIGSGMLIAVGAYNGFERGATTSFARRAWEEAGLVKWRSGAFSMDGFFLDPNELRSGDTNTRLAGAKSELSLGENQYVGAAYMNVFQSTFPYIGAPLQFFPDGREGLNTMHVYSRWNPWEDSVPGFYMAGDFAHQWNDRIDMRSNAFSGEIGQAFTNVAFAPRLAYTYRSFDGDDPTTARYEKFDPLFYEGSPPLWASGSNGSFSFLNSNVLLHRLSLAVNLSERDIVSIYYWHIRAEEVNSPIQFGQAGRIVNTGGEPQLVTGVPNAHLSDDFYLEHFRTLSPNLYITSGLAVSIPGRGLRQLVLDPTTWFGGLVSLAFQY